ncbi:MAG: LLM class flavin-dependent oxidoreductase [Alphaproteobacteria bacterium]
MQFGLNFYPCLGPEQRSAAQHFREILHLAQLCDTLGFTHVREVEHYFEPYGGYSPNPIVVLAAAAAVTRKMRLVTGAVLPAFNNPLKLAGEIGMLDAISGGRLDVGFARICPAMAATRSMGTASAISCSRRACAAATTSTSSIRNESPTWAACIRIS